MSSNGHDCKFAMERCGCFSSLPDISPDQDPQTRGILCADSAFASMADYNHRRVPWLIEHGWAGELHICGIFLQ